MNDIKLFQILSTREDIGIVQGPSVDEDNFFDFHPGPILYGKPHGPKHPWPGLEGVLEWYGRRRKVLPDFLSFSSSFACTDAVRAVLDPLIKDHVSWLPVSLPGDLVYWVIAPSRMLSITPQGVVTGTVQIGTSLYSNSTDLRGIFFTKSRLLHCGADIAELVSKYKWTGIAMHNVYIYA